MASRVNNLTTLIKRLEAATSRLEDLVPTADDPEGTADGSIEDTQTSGLRSISGPSGQSSAPPSGPNQEQIPPSILDFNAVIKNEVKVFVEQSQQIGSHVADQANALLEAFQAEERHLRVALKAKKPDIQSSSYVQILKEIQSGMGAVSDVREANRASPLFSHLSAVSEGSSILGWVAVEPKPVEFIKESFDSARFYGNRVIQEYKEKEPAHVEWVKSLYRINDALTTFVKKHYEGGLTWNSNGIDPVDALKEVQSGQPNSKASKAPLNAGGPPPPPPLPKFDNPPAPPMPPNGALSSSSNDMGAVFDQISRGTAVTSGLKKVDPSQMTHKNPSLRATSTVPTNGSLSRNSSSSSLNRPNKKPKPESMRTKKPARKELDGNKWIVEHYDNSPDLVEIEVQTKHSILISRCAKTTIRIKGKANAISVDNSPSLNIIIDSLVSSIDVIKCPSFAVQVTGVLPTIMLDQVDGAQIYLGTDSLKTQILQSKCSGLNVLLPGESEEDDFREMAAPEQIRSYVRDGRLISEIVEHAG